MMLVNGDSNDVFDDVVNEFCGVGKQIILVSDPPFNINYKYRTYKDKMPQDEYLKMLKKFFGKFPSVVVHYPEETYRLAATIEKIPEKVVAWVYPSNTGKQHRDIVFFDIKPNFRQMTQPYKNPNDKRIQKLISGGREGGRLYDWWEINQVKNVSKEKTEHPCQMPVEVMDRVIGILPKECVVIDPFMGSGTTGVSVERMNQRQKAYRDFVGIEIDKRYYEIAVERIEEARNDKG